MKANASAAWLAAILLAIPVLASAQWKRVEGGLAYVSIGSGSHIWGTGSSGTIFRRDGGSWTLIPGTLSFVSVGSDGEVWGVNFNANPSRREGNAWVQKPGRVATVSVGSAQHVWAIGTGNSDRSYLSNKLFRWDGANWIAERGPMDEGAEYSSVSVDAQGNLWVTTKKSAIYRRPAGGTWQLVAGGLKQISGSGRFVMGVAENGSIWRWNGTTWSLVPGTLKWISVSSDGYAWGTNASDMIFNDIAHPVDEPPVASAGDRNTLPYRTFITAPQCLMSANKKFKACLEQGVLYVRQNSARGQTFFASPYGPEVYAGSPDHDHKLVADTDGSVCIVNKRGRRWYPPEVRSGAPLRFLVLGDDGNLCVFPGLDWPTRTGPGVWCTNTGRTIVDAQLRKYPVTPFTDVAAAMQLFDDGLPVGANLKHTNANAPDYPIQFGGGGSNVSYCFELENKSNRPLLVATAWQQEGSVRMWGVVKPGTKLRFDNRGDSWITCVNCESRVSGSGAAGNPQKRRAHWGSELEMWEVGVNDKWPEGGCSDMLGVGPRH